MPRKGYAWVFTPGSGGKPVPKHRQEEVRKRILALAEKKYAGAYERIDVRFRGKFCYIDAYQSPPPVTARELKQRGQTREEYEQRFREYPLHLCRLLHYSIDDDRWGCAFYTYSNERYEICGMSGGKFEGTLEEGFDIGATYLR